jgi:hypothetical protein
MDHPYEDHNRVHFPLLSSELTAALGAIEDMADNRDVVPDSALRNYPPAIFRAGGPMSVLTTHTL